MFLKILEICWLFVASSSNWLKPVLRCRALVQPIFKIFKNILFLEQALLKYLLILLLAISTLTACTTGEDSSDGLEELEDETEEMVGDEVTDNAEDETSDEEETEEVADNEAEEGADADSEDDEFLAEDSTSPAAPTADKLEEKDLQNELEKDNMASVPGAPGVTPPDVEPQINAQPPPPPVPVDPVANTAGTPPAPSVAASSAEASTSSGLTDDGFEVINPPPLPQEDLGVPAPLVADVDPPLPSEKAAKELVPLSKIEQKTFMRNGRLINTIYFVRPNEDLGAISQKIFNEDKTAVLVADNDFVLKGLEAGDRIYYNSPNRPTDDKLMLTYYEDNKMPPQYYVTRKGDDIKKIGREVLGTELGWKEIWSTNEVLQTQALLPAGLKIRYWSGSEPRLSNEATGPSLAATAPSDMPTSSASISEPAPETLPDLPPSPEPAPMPSEDPGMAVATAMLPPSSSSLPTVQSPTPVEETSLMTVAAIAMIGMAGLAIVAIQIKNRKKDNGALPPSLEFTKV